MSDKRITFQVLSDRFEVSITRAIKLRDELSIKIVAAGRSEVEIDADRIVLALRHQLGLLDDLKKKSPAEVQRVYEFLAAHARSACPAATMIGEVP